MTTLVEPIQWQTPTDLSVQLQISLSTLGTWRSTGKGPKFYRFGGLIRYNPADVTAWTEAQAS